MLSLQGFVGLGSGMTGALGSFLLLPCAVEGGTAAASAAMALLQLVSF